jgi:IS1 family transposase
MGWMNGWWKARRDRAGKHCERVQEAIVVQGHLDLVQGPPDEIRVKGGGMIVWMAMAVMVSTRLWLGGVVSTKRDRALADRLLRLVRACAGGVASLLVCTDGWGPYPNSIRRAFRQKVKGPGRGAPRLEIWPQLIIGRVIKHTQTKRVIKVTHEIIRGTMRAAKRQLQASCGGSLLNTASIERFNGTLRERLATLTRRCRHAARRVQALHTGMYLIGCTSNLCWPPNCESATTISLGYPVGSNALLLWRQG